MDRIRGISFLVVALAAGTLQARGLDCRRGEGPAECVGRHVDEEVNKRSQQFQDKLNQAQKDLNAAKSNFEKARGEAEKAKKELERVKAEAQKQAQAAGQRAINAIPGAPPEIVAAAECVKRKAGKALFGVRLEDAARHPEQLVRAALNRFDGVARGALADAKSGFAPPSGGFNIAASSDKGFEANIRLQPGKLDVNKFIDGLVAGMQRMRKVDPVAECLVPLLQRQAAAIKRDLPPAVAAFEKQLFDAMEPVAIEVVAQGLLLAVDKIGPLLGDKEAKHILQAAAAESLLDPQRVMAISAALNTLAQAKDPQSLKASSDAALKLLNASWQPKAEDLMRVIKPAAKAGIKFVANKAVTLSAPYVYDFAFWSLKKTVYPAAQTLADELCSIGDAIATWACAIAVQMTDAAWDATVAANKKPVTDIAVAVAGVLIDIAVDQAANQLDKTAAAKSGNALLQRAIDRTMALDRSGKLKKAIQQTLHAMTEDYVKRMLAAMDAYNHGVAALVRARQGVVAAKN